MPCGILKVAGRLWQLYLYTQLLNMNAHTISSQILHPPHNMASFCAGMDSRPGSAQFLKQQCSALEADHQAVVDHWLRPYRSRGIDASEVVRFDHPECEHSAACPISMALPAICAVCVTRSCCPQCWQCKDWHTLCRGAPFLCLQACWRIHSERLLPTTAMQAFKMCHKAWLCIWLMRPMLSALALQRR